MSEVRHLSPRELKELHTNVLTKDDRTAVRAMVEGYVMLEKALNDKTVTIRKLLQMFFGEKTEKAHTVTPRPKNEKQKPRGHGRKGASAYAGANKIIIPHTLKSGDVCPECEKGKLYPSTPGVTIRITGARPLEASIREQEKLRCNCCGEVFTAVLPETRTEKYDPSARAPQIWNRRFLHPAGSLAGQPGRSAQDWGRPSPIC